MSTLNDKKHKVQQAARAAWLKGGEWGLLAMATGTGKSKCAVDEHLRLDLILFGQVRVLLVVPTEKLRDDNWRLEYDKWGAHKQYDQVTRVCYASVNRLKQQYFDLAIFDEGHNSTPHNAVFFQNNTCKRVLVLSATPPDKTDKVKFELFKQLRFKTDFNYPLKQALEDGLVSNFEVWVVETKLDNTEKYIKAGTKVAPFMQTEQARYDFLSKQIRGLFKKPEAMKWKMLERMRLIYSSIEKTAVTKRLLNRINVDDNRIIVFCGSIEQAEELMPVFEGEQKCTYHSETNGKALAAFINKEIHILGVVRAVNEGMNLPDMDMGIIVQLNSNARDLVQRVGRCIRFRDDNHVARIFILVAQGTQDQKWFEAAIEEFPKHVVHYVHAKNI